MALRLARLRRKVRRFLCTLVSDELSGTNYGLTLGLLVSLLGAGFSESLKEAFRLMGLVGVVLTLYYAFLALYGARCRGKDAGVIWKEGEFSDVLAAFALTFVLVVLVFELVRGLFGF